MVLRALTILSGIAFAALVPAACIGVVLFAFPGVLPDFEAREPTGCYWGDAMSVFIECRGFQSSGYVEWMLNLPLFLFLYAPMFAIHSWQEHPAMLLSAFYLQVVWLIVGLMFPFFFLARIWLRATLRD